jgi:hypothetical protein
MGHLDRTGSHKVVQMYDSDHMTLSIEDRQRHHSMPFHLAHGTRGQLVGLGGLRSLRHDLDNPDCQEMLLPLHEACQITRRNHADQFPPPIHYSHSASFLSQQHDAIPHRRCRLKYWEVITDHDLLYPKKASPQIATRMKPGKVLRAKAFLEKERHSQGIA